MPTLQYGDASLASFPSNTQGLISAEDMQDVIVSQRSGGNEILGAETFVVPITDGAPTAVNPLIVNPQVSGGLWSADANNRQYPDYASAIPGLTIPTGYTKFAQIFFTLSCEKIGSGEDNYTFQVDNNGTPQGIGLSYGLGTVPSVISFLVNTSVTLDAAPLLGLTVTGDGTADDITIYAFEQFVIDFQIWSTPLVAQQLPVIVMGTP